MKQLMNLIGLFLLSGFFAGDSKSEVITTFNNGATNAGDPSAGNHWLRINNPVSPAEPYFRINSFTVNISGPATLTGTLFGLSASTGGTATQISTTGSQSLTGTGNKTITFSTTPTLYSAYDHFVLNLNLTANVGNISNANVQTNGTPFSGFDTSVLSSAYFVTAQNGDTKTTSGQPWVSISASAVPEPGTMVFGALAAMSGVGGWWIRRKRRGELVPVAETLESIEGVA